MANTTEQLILEAKAMGFTEAAKAQDVLAEAQKRLAETSKALEGARGSGSVEQVAKLTAEHEKLTQTVSLFGGEQSLVNEKMANFGEAVRRVHPLLGDAVAAMSRYTGAAAAAGIVIAGITAAIRAMGEAWEKSNKAVSDNSAALTGMKGADRNRGQSIENIRAGTKLGPFGSQEEARAAKDQAGQLSRNYGFIDSQSIDEAVALTSGQGFSNEETARVARMLEIPSMRAGLKLSGKESPDRLNAKLRKGLDKNKGNLDTTFSVEAQQKATNRAIGFQQLGQMGGSTLELQEIIRDYAPEGANTEFLAQLGQAVGSKANLDTFEERSQALGGIPRSIAEGIAKIVPGADSPILHATPQDFASLRGVFQERTKRDLPSYAPSPLPPGTMEPGYSNPDRIMRPWQPQSSAEQPASSTTHIDNRSYNARNIGAFASGQKSAMRNGDWKADQLEMV